MVAMFLGILHGPFLITGSGVLDTLWDLGHNEELLHGPSCGIGGGNSLVQTARDACEPSDW
jgi:hypothetical protein